MAELRPLIVPCDCCEHQRARFNLLRRDGSLEGRYCQPCAERNFQRLDQAEREESEK